MKTWEREAKVFLKQLGEGLGLDVHPKEQICVDQYKPDARPEVLRYNSLDNELKDYMLLGTEAYNSREFERA